MPRQSSELKDLIKTISDLFSDKTSWSITDKRELRAKNRLPNELLSLQDCQMSK
jgi:hypothetical protein